MENDSFVRCHVYVKKGSPSGDHECVQQNSAQSAHYYDVSGVLVGIGLIVKLQLKSDEYEYT